jgi:guanine nucleotide-binding protein subunit alpha
MNGVGRRKSVREFGVRGWIGALGLPVNSTRASAESPKDDEDDEPTEILSTLGEDIAALWEDLDIRDLLTRRGVRVEDQPGLSAPFFYFCKCLATNFHIRSSFLSDTARIATRNYVPSDNDVVRARLRTLGVQEWRIVLEGESS